MMPPYTHFRFYFSFDMEGIRSTLHAGTSSNIGPTWRCPIELLPVWRNAVAGIAGWIDNFGPTHSPGYPTEHSPDLMEQEGGTKPEGGTPRGHPTDESHR